MSTGTVLIVGGGIAGLAAAQELATHGCRVVMLEARSRLGGRILTNRDSSGKPVELGAEFIHGKNPELWAILKKAGLRTREASERHVIAKPDSSLARYQFEEELQQLVGRISRGQPDESFIRFLSRQSFSVEMCRNALDYVEGFHAANPERFSTQAFAAAENLSALIEGEKAFRIEDGYDALVSWFKAKSLDAGAEILLDAEVKAIRWHPQCISVEALIGGRQKLFPGCAAVITLPLGVLKAGTVTFDPVLPDKEQAIANLDLGQVTRMVFQFRDRFWPDRLGFLHTFDDWLPTWWTSDHPLSLTAWAGGPRGERGAQAHRGFLVEHAMCLLGRVLVLPPKVIREQLTGIHTHNWHDDPFARVAYSVVPVGQVDAPSVLAEPVMNTLFFAGEATSKNQNGTVHGALNSGLRAAREVLAIKKGDVALKSSSTA